MWDCTAREIWPPCRTGTACSVRGERFFASATDAKETKKAACLFGQNEGITSLFFSYFSGVNDLQL